MWLRTGNLRRTRGEDSAGVGDDMKAPGLAHDSVRGTMLSARGTRTKGNQQGRLQSFTIDPTALAWPEQLSKSIRLDSEPYKTWLSRVVDIDVDNVDPTGWEALHSHVKASGVKRICNAPLAAPHRLLGVLSPVVGAYLTRRRNPLCWVAGEFR